MKWEIANLFEPETGKAYDCMNIDKKDLIRTAWNEPTDETSDDDVFGMSSAVALMFNCQSWKRKMYGI